jgi:sterol desaturase/sphingolipid hydroxylase (fatty acid hydroxylase superfamily)
MSSAERELPAWLRGVVVVGAAGALLALELRRELRKSKREPKALRDARNLLIAAGAGLAMHFAEAPLSSRLSRQVHKKRWGLAPRLASDPVAQTAVAVILLDYGLYVWHVLTHRIPFLWRFHLVHHIDLDLDASTALRFHFGEMLLSVPWRLAQVAAAGASPLALSIWQTLLLVSILFHHSNVSIPMRAERLLSFLVTTPRQHGIHHQADKRLANSNWSSGLAVWDLIHGTYCWGANQEFIGVPAYPCPNDVTLKRSLTIPFGPQRDDWNPLAAILPPRATLRA